MDVPVLIITYRRFNLVMKTLEMLERQGFKNVYLSVDDYENGAADFKPVKQYLQTQGFTYKIKAWERNVGCDTNVIEGIRWFFSHTTHGIILEDDCMPTGGFRALVSQVVNGPVNHNVSLFSTPLKIKGKEWHSSFLPIYWGWYTNQAFFNAFYSFYHQQKIGVPNIRRVLARPVSLRIKLISVMNYYAHRSRKKGIAWDSVLFFYLLQENETFLIPPVSVISNEGFGDSGSTHTHTSMVPGWYKDVVFNDSVDSEPMKLAPYNAMADTGFLETFFGNYTASCIKLMGSIFKSVFSSYLKGRNK